MTGGESVSKVNAFENFSALMMMMTDLLSELSSLVHTFTLVQFSVSVHKEVGDTKRFNSSLFKKKKKYFPRLSHRPNTHRSL